MSIYKESKLGDYRFIDPKRKKKKSKSRNIVLSLFSVLNKESLETGVGEEKGSTDAC